MRARARRDEKAKRWIVHLSGPVLDWQPSPVYTSLVRMVDARWTVDPDARLRGQARVERAWVEGTLIEIGHGECDLENEPRALCDARRVRFDWKQTGQFVTGHRDAIHQSAAVELRPDGTAWEGGGFFG